MRTFPLARPLALPLALAATIALASCAPRAGAPSTAVAGADTGRDCFFLSQVSGYTVTRDDRVRISTAPREVYEFETLGRCPEVDRGEAIALDQAGPGTICRGIDVDLIVSTSIGPKRCPVKMIRKLIPPAG